MPLGHYLLGKPTNKSGTNMSDRSIWYIFEVAPLISNATEMKGSAEDY